MKSLLYICHSYHYKTRSNRFLVELLSPYFEITEFGYDPYSDTDAAYAELPSGHFDVVLCFQILPPRDVLERYISFTSGVFFPMFDAGPAAEDHRWVEYKDFLIVNFSRTMHERCLYDGLNSRYIQYFPQPGEVTDEGRVDSLFFWHRVEYIGMHTVHRLFEGTGVRHIHLHDALDPGQKDATSHEVWDVDITRTSWFDDKAALLAAMQESALYMAPRPTEGIGMSFLEAMALGRCVVAPDLPTMNEYIRHGENGILYDIGSPSPLELGDIRAMQKAARQSIVEGRERWDHEKQDICRWIEEKYAVDTAPRPTVTIVTCTYDIIRNGRRRWFEDCLRSIRSQRYAGEIEHIVIDGASSDGTLEFLRARAPHVAVFSEPDEGIYDAMNKGLARARGEYIAFLNSDDFYCSETAVDDSVRALMEHGADVSYADAFLIDKDSGEVRASWRGGLELVPFGQYPCHQTVFVRTSLLRELGGFDMSFCCLADNNVLCTLLGLRAKFCRVHDHIVKFRDGGFSNDEKLQSRIQEEKRKRGQESFHRWFGGGLTRSECDLLYDFRYRMKKPEEVQSIGESLPCAAWRREFFRALFGQPSGLVRWGESMGRCFASEDRLYYVNFADALRYLFCRMGAALGNAEQKDRLAAMKAVLGGRKLGRLVQDGLRCERYKVLSSLLWGRKRKKYREKYRAAKARRQRVKLKQSGRKKG